MMSSELCFKQRHLAVVPKADVMGKDSRQGMYHEASNDNLGKTSLKSQQQTRGGEMHARENGGSLG